MYELLDSIAILLPTYTLGDSIKCQGLMALVCKLYNHDCRWVCTSGLPSDLALTDSLALQVMEELATKGSA